MLLQFCARSQDRTSPTTCLRGGKMWETHQVEEKSLGELGITKKLFAAWPLLLTQGFCSCCGAVVLQERRVYIVPAVGTCHSQTDVEIYLAHLVEIQQGQSRSSVWPWVLTGPPTEEGKSAATSAAAPWFGLPRCAALPPSPSNCAAQSEISRCPAHKRRISGQPNRSCQYSSPPAATSEPAAQNPFCCSSFPMPWQHTCSKSHDLPCHGF